MPDTTPADRPADQLRAAAEKLRAAAAAVPSDDWGTRPWHVEECSDTDTMESCLCIVAQGEHKEFDQPQVPLIQYVADAETTEHAAWIALMHPGVGLALAAWLESAAERLGDAKASLVALLDPSALEVARQLLGTTEGEDAAAVGPAPQDHPGVDLFAALQHAGFDVDEANARMYAYAAMVLRQEKATAAPPAPADRAAVLREAADIAESLREFTPAYGARKSAQISENVGVLRVADHFRALADDAAAGVQPPTTGEAHHPRRCTVMIPGVGRCEQNADHPAPHAPEPAAPAVPEERS
ncbi:hypothetical protein [Streptomyces badius]